MAVETAATIVHVLYRLRQVHRRCRTLQDKRLLESSIADLAALLPEGLEGQVAAVQERALAKDEADRQARRELKKTELPF